MTYEELIATLEVATGPSFALDVEIKRVCGVPHNPRYAALQYTSSLDAALSLVPDDACWTISVPRQPDMSGKRYWASIRSNHHGARGSTPAIALCIAALKARTVP